MIKDYSCLKVADLPCNIDIIKEVLKFLYTNTKTNGPPHITPEYSLP